MDMPGAYLSTVRRALGPDANERIVFAKYHLASLLGNAVNTVRRDEHKALLAQHDERLTGTRHLFLMNPRNMSGAQWAGLKPLISSNLKVGRAWAIKETFMDAFAVRQPARAERALKEVLAWMSRSRLAPIVRAGRTLRRHFDGVMNAILSGITNATAEAINSRIPWLKNQAAGFRSRERFRQSIYFHLGDLDLYPDEVSACSHPKP